MFFFLAPERSSKALTFLFLFISFCTFRCVKDVFPHLSYSALRIALAYVYMVIAIQPIQYIVTS